MTHSMTRCPDGRRISVWPGLLLPIVLCLGCSGPAPLTVEMPLHLEEHLGAATVTGSEVPANPPQPIEWRFDAPQPQWTSARVHPSRRPAQTRTENALRLSLREANRFPRRPGSVGPPPPLGVSIYVDLPDWVREDWAYVLVRARTSEHVRNVGIGFNLLERSDTATGGIYRFNGESAIVVHDGSVQTYLLRADWSGGRWHGPWRQLGLMFSAQNPASIDLLSISVVPKDAGYTATPAGVRAEVREGVHRRTLYTHAPGRLEYRVRVPEAGRLDVGLGVLRDDVPVSFRITTNAGPDSAPLLEETIRDKEHWTQRTVDLSHLAGRTVTLALEASAERAGTVALWGAPTLTGARRTGRPNVIFYVIDGGGADYMSVYGYHRRTTPTLERLAAEGAVFERAYSNASWTQPSTASFMTSLQHSVLGGTRSQVNPVPEEAVTMAEHMHRAGYQTGVFIANPNAGTLQNLHRGVDVMREGWSEFSYFGGEGSGNYKESSRFLAETFWRWREAYPGMPYWVHFQSTDVHEEFPAVAPFSGLFVNPDQVTTWRAWEKRLNKAGGGHGIYSEAYQKTGISRVAFFSIHQALYDETMAHNDYQLGRLVERLKAAGEWDNTLLIIGADHSTRAAMDDMGIANRDSLPPRWSQPMFRPSISRVPLIVVWPGRIRGAQRFSQPVSMIDVLPTVLDLLDLPAPTVAMGQSLAPLLLGQAGWDPRPVILEEFRVDPDSAQLRGVLEVVDGRWGASLEINPNPETPPDQRRPAPLLVYDLWSDPFCLRSLHEQRPDLVEKYTKFLEAQGAAHQALAKRFSRSGNVALTPEQLQMLRSLGYIR